MSLDLESRILVAALPHPRDFELARLPGWYRIPLRRATQMVAVDYLAFFQPSTFGECGGRVEFIAPVPGQDLEISAGLLAEVLGILQGTEEAEGTEGAKEKGMPDV